MKTIKQASDDIGKGRFTPADMKGREYRALTKGEQIVITGCTISVYQARDKKTGEPLFRDDGSPVLNKTAYLALEDGTLASVKGNVAMEQLESCYDDAIPEAVGYYPCATWERIAVEVDLIDQKFGKDTYPVPAFKV